MNIYDWIIKTFFTKDIAEVLGQMNKTLADLEVVQTQQLAIGTDLEAVILSAQAAQRESDMTREHAGRVADKLAELLK